MRAVADVLDATPCPRGFGKSHRPKELAKLTRRVARRLTVMSGPLSRGWDEWEPVTAPFHEIQRDFRLLLAIMTNAVPALVDATWPALRPDPPRRAVAPRIPAASPRARRTRCGSNSS